MGIVEIKDDSSQLVGVKSTFLDEQLKKMDVDQGPISSPLNSHSMPWSHKLRI